MRKPNKSPTEELNLLNEKIQKYRMMIASLEKKKKEILLKAIDSSEKGAEEILGFLRTGSAGGKQ